MKRMPAQRAHERDRLVRQQAADLGRAGRGRERRVDHVDVERQERRPVAHARAHPRRRTRAGVQVRSSSQDTISKPHARGSSRSDAAYSDPRMPASSERVGVDQALLQRALERRAVEVALAVVLLPRVGVGVEQDDGRPGPWTAACARSSPSTIEWSPPSISGTAPARSTGSSCAAICSVVRTALPGRRREIAEVGQRERAEDVDALRGVPRPQQQRGVADAGRAEARAGAHRGRGVERDADDGDVDALGRRHVRRPRERADAGVARGAPARAG